MPGATGPEQRRAAKAGALNQGQTPPRRQGERGPEAADCSGRERVSKPGPEAECLPVKLITICINRVVLVYFANV